MEKVKDTIYRQDAIDAVISLCDDCDSDYCGYCRVNFEGVKDARKVLKDLPSAQPEPCEDTVSRQAAIDAIKNTYGLSYIEDGFNRQDAVSILENLPSAQPDIAEKLYQYKCYITDKNGLQHEVIHTGDIRRVTGWEI